MEIISVVYFLFIVISCILIYNVTKYFPFSIKLLASLLIISFMMHISYKSYSAPKRQGLGGMLDGFIEMIIAVILIMSGIVGSLVYAFNSKDYSIEKFIRSYIDAFLSVTIGYCLGNYATFLLTQIT